MQRRIRHTVVDVEEAAVYVHLEPVRYVIVLGKVGGPAGLQRLGRHPDLAGGEIQDRPLDTVRTAAPLREVIVAVEVRTLRRLIAQDGPVAARRTRRQSR